MIKAISNLTNSTMHSFKTPLRSANADRSTHTQASRSGRLRCALRRRMAAIAALLLGVSIPAMAYDYVITYTTNNTTYYLGMNGNSLQAKTTFDPTCIWTCYNGDTETTLSSDNSYSLRNKNNSTYYLTTSVSREQTGGSWYNPTYSYTWSALSVQNSASNMWRSSSASNGNVYAYYSSGGWNGWNRSASIYVNNLTMHDNNTSDSKNARVTITTGINDISNPTISGSDIITSTGNSNYTASGAKYKVEYTNYYFSNTDHYFDKDGNSFSGSPSNATIGTYTWSLTNNEYASLDANTPGRVIVSTLPPSDLTVTLTASATATGGNPAAPAGTVLTGTKEITIQGSTPSAPIINISGTTVTLSTNASGSTTIRYTTNGSDPTTNTGTVYNGTPFDVSSSESSPVIIKAITVRSGNASDIAEGSVTLTLPAPVITINGEAKTATITSSVPGTTIRYTVNSSDPTASYGTIYDGTITGLSYMAEVKAIAVKEGWNDSPVSSDVVTIPSGVNPSTGEVTLFDYEPHSWSYYSNTDLPDQLHSLNPADIKITYNGNGTGNMTAATNAEAVDAPTSFSLSATGVQVGPSETANTFIYYKTIERESPDGTGNLPYTTIPNPFQVRPNNGTSGSVTITPNSRNVYLSWSCTNWTYNNTTATASFTYTDASGISHTETYSSNGNTTINVKPGTKVTLKVKASRNRDGYRPTLTARLDNNNGTQIGTITGSNTNEVTSETSAITVSATTITASAFRGFYAWRVKSLSTGLSIKDAENTNTTYAVNSIIPAERKILFVTNNEYNNEVVFEALWAQAYVQTGSTNLSNYVPAGVTSAYERNFHVISSSTAASDMQKTYPCTVIGHNPNSTTLNNTRTITGGFTAAADTKFEDLIWNGGNNSTISGNNHNLTIGRGVSASSGSCATYVYGVNSDFDENLDYTLRIESGKFGTVAFLSGYSGESGDGYPKQYYRGTDNHIKAVLGNDYDRANEDDESLTISNNVHYGYIYKEYGLINQDVSKEVLVVTTKSGSYMSDNASSDASEAFYMGIGSYGGQNATNPNVGMRTLVIEGGQFQHIAGGVDANNGSTQKSFIIRMHGGTVKGSIYGAGAFAAASGIRSFIFTGGSVEGWIACGANGTTTSTTGDNMGRLPSDTYLYVGGKTKVGTSDATLINTIEGGNVFGAGNGGTYNSGRPNSGEVQNSTVVIADDADIYRDVFGGGNQGHTANTADVYMLGGTINGNLYVGSNKNSGTTANLLMTGGIVKKGIYGGSNSSGTISGNVTLNINGGQVGTPSSSANIHGGGYGNSTEVTGNIDLTLGTTTQTTPGVTVYGDVYGGSALGKVNGTSVSTTKHTNVTLNAGIINGSLYGGALGNDNIAANVYAPVKVEVNGGSVTGAIYGCNNVNGAPQSTVNVDINGTDQPESGYALAEVYGGGNKAAYNGTPVVAIHNCDNSIGYVYGGGNATDVEGTDITVWGGNTIGYVFGGGNGDGQDNPGANVGSEGTNVKIRGGSIDHVFGGGNMKGTISGDIVVNINKQTESGHNSCEMHIGEVYGGGNQAPSAAGSITVGCTGDEGEGIDDLYGGANAANITSGNISLSITGGSINRVFGGNNARGEISGAIAVNVNWKTTDPCGYNYLGYVFGGGNHAAYSGIPTVTITNGTVSHNVYGGGNEAGVAGGSVTMNGGAVLEGIYGGCNTSGTVSGAIAVTINAGTVGTNATQTANVHGGGYGQSTATGNDVTVTIGNGTSAPVIWGDVYGGSALGNVNDALTETTKVWLRSGTVNGCLYGGGLGDADNAALVNGKVQVIVDGGAVKSTTNTTRTTGNVFGCNNVNGTPKGTVEVEINSTAASTGSGENKAYALQGVYGGGNLAHYNPASASASADYPKVTVACGTSVKDVYGGGNAAATPNTNVIIEGGDIDRVFAGGNGESGTPANVGYMNTDSEPTSGSYGNGNAKATINGGTINQIFGGSNANGVIRGTMTVNVEKNSTCAMVIDQIYGGGNMAASGPGTVNITCTGTAQTDYINYVYGGANQADVTGDITLNIIGGRINNVFGGNNSSGTIDGDITVNVDWSQGSCNGNYLGNVFGGGNLAAYSQKTAGHPAVNIKHATVSHSVYGGGKGSTAIVTGNPVVTIGDATASHCAIVTENVYGGGDAAAVNGNTTVTYNDNNASSTVAKLFGGGNAASVSGTTTVTLTNGKVTGGVYGGCNSSGSVGVVTVALNGGAVGANGNTADVYGGGYGSPTTTTGNVTVTLDNTTVYGDIYGGSALGKVNSSSANPANMTTVTINGTGLHGSVFGGGKGDNETQAISYGDATVNINGASAYTGIYGGANVNGLVSGDILLNINANIGDIGSGNSRDAFGGGYGALTQTGGDVTVNVGNGTNSPIIYGAVYGGSALGTVNANASNNTTVNVLSGTIHGNIYGGGLGESGANNVNKGQVNGVVTVNIGATDGAQSPTYSGNATIDGSVYGCNNTNGSPKANVTVNVYKTAHNTTNAATYTEDDGTNGNPTYAIDQVFGGGNQADYNPTSTDSRATVHVYTCDNTIRRVFGGGNAAAAYGVVTTIDGGRFDYIFGGGNGEDAAANIGAGGTNLTVNSGTINYLFGGSNEQGTINGTMGVVVNNIGCTERIKNFFAGGNLAVIGSQGNPVELSTTIACGTVFDAVYGGSNLADIYGNVTMTINGGTIGEVYAGSKGVAAGDATYAQGKAANIYGNTTLNIYAGEIGNAFGGSNINGNITGTITVNMDWSQSSCSDKSINNVFGASNLATYTPTNANGNYPQVNIIHGTVSGSVFGAGNGDANDASKGVVTSNPVVTIGDSNADHYVVVGGNVYGGGNNAAVTGNTSVTYNDSHANSTVAKLFGGGNAAGVSGTSAVTLTNGKVTAGIYGGCNASGAIGGNITVSLNGGIVGTSGSTPDIVFGGGYGAPTSTGGNVTLAVNGSTVHGNVYGGSALGSVNATSSNTTTVNILDGIINGNIYGGGLGEAGAANVAKGQVNGTVTVNIGATDGAQNPTYSGNATINGDVYGCNNTNGSPKANVFVNVYKTAHNEAANGYAIDQVFGGGNQADYNPTSNESRTTVHVYTCDNTIRRVFAGGNAAAAIGVANIIDGGRFQYVYGGGNGEVSAADIGAGGTNLQVHGGNITYLFGGSNHSGTITGQMRVSVDGDGACAKDMYIAEFFCGNNEAPINTSIVAEIGCGTKFGDVYGGCNMANINGNVTLTIKGGEMNNVYGGSKGSNTTAADITGNVTLNIYGGNINYDAFGGSNINGNIGGNIIVNMDWSQASESCNSESDLHVRNVFGASNLAAYTPTNASGNYPQVNIKHGTVSGSVFGAGNGDRNDPTKGIVTSNPVVTIGDNTAAHVAIVTGNVYGGGNNASVTGSTTVTYNDNNASSTVAKLFGGGNAAGVTGAAAVTLTNGKVTGGVYGGCNSSGTIGGNALVTVTGGTVGANAAHANIHGGGYGQQTAVSGDVTVNIGSVTGTGNSAVYSGSATIYGDVYGGSALGTVNTDHSGGGTYNKTAVNLYGGTIDGNVYGGGLGDANTAALVYGDVDVFQYGAILIARYSQGLPSSGMIFGCNNVNGTPKGHVRVGVYKTTETTGQQRSNAEKRATHTESDHTYEMSAVFGGGNQAAYVPDDLTNGSTEVFINGCDEVSIHSVYGGGNAASTPATLVTIQGAYEIEYVFGGGNGAGTGNPGANVGYHAYNAADPAIGGPSDEAKAARQQFAYGSGEAKTQIYGGRLHKVFGGSNTLGNVRVATVAMLDETSSCTLELDGIYGGGKSAYMEGNAEIELGCIHGLDEIYGGAEQADVGSNIVLTLTSGHYNKVYGGNNLGGKILGSITVNIEQTGCLPIEIGELYLGGNNAPYSVYGYNANGTIIESADHNIYDHPVMNLRSFKSIGTVFGGGEGSGATLAGNPIINVNVVTGWVDGQYKGTGEQDANSIYHAAPQALTPDGVIGTIFGGGNAAKVTGNTTINIADSAEVKMQSLNAIKQKIEAEIEADPNKDYIITGGMKFELSDDKKSIKYTVQGQNTPTMTQPIIQTVNGANITGNVYGGGNQADVTGGTTIKVGPEGTPQQASPAPSPAPSRPEQTQTQQPTAPQSNAATESQQTRTANPTRL